MLKEIYEGGFNSWDDVVSNFRYVGKKPTHVIFANYDNGGYEGSAFVLFREGRNKYGIVQGSHCSCYGLEDQWEPEFYDKKTLKQVLAKHSYYISEEDRAKLLTMI